MYSVAERVRKEKEYQNINAALKDIAREAGYEFKRSGDVYQGESCVLCGDELTNDLERDTGVCDPCGEV